MADALEDIVVEPAESTGVSHFLRDSGELWQVREYAAVRSLYDLKEADPHAWVLPRLWGRAKAGMAAVEFDEFGGGRADRVHAQHFADLTSDLGLDTTYGRYLDAARAEVLVTVNLMSLFRLHRALRGALVGHFAAVEVTSSPGSRRLVTAFERVQAGPAAVFFYAEHVVAGRGARAGRTAGRGRRPAGGGARWRRMWRSASARGSGPRAGWAGNCSMTGGRAGRACGRAVRGGPCGGASARVPGGGLAGGRAAVHGRRRRGRGVRFAGRAPVTGVFGHG